MLVCFAKSCATLGVKITPCTNQEQVYDVTADNLVTLVPLRLLAETINYTVC